MSILEKVSVVNMSGGFAQPQGRQGARLGTRASPDVGYASSTSSTAHGPGPHRRARAAGSSRTPTHSTGHREESRSCCIPGGGCCEVFPPPRPQDSVTFNCGPCQAHESAARCWWQQPQAEWQRNGAVATTLLCAFQNPCPEIREIVFP